MGYSKRNPSCGERQENSFRLRYYEGRTWGIAMRASILFTAALCVTTQAFAQDAATMERLTREAVQRLVGTISVENRPSFVSGQLQGCTIEYYAMARDNIYKQGAFIKVGGSFGLLSSRGMVSPVLKVMLHDVDPLTMSFTPSTPVSAYFVSRTSTTKAAIVGHIPSDTPGAVFVVFKPETFAVMAEGLTDNKLTIAFARTRGGMDVVLPIDTTVVDTSNTGERTRSHKPVSEFFECSKALLNQVMR
jgi:hypothetical protein